VIRFGYVCVITSHHGDRANCHKGEDQNIRHKVDEPSPEEARGSQHALANQPAEYAGHGNTDDAVVVAKPEKTEVINKACLEPTARCRGARNAAR
jgi:hypothetical protein